ncbi:TlpA family protein disulfide reductase [Candidatus Zixiibacteriota bacterium]
MNKRIGLCIFLCGLILAAAAGAEEIALEDTVGEKKKVELSQCPDFQLKNLQGQRIALADLLGKGPILISFWATWCKPCIKELPHLQEMYDEYREQGFQVIAISEDTPRSLSKVKSFIAGKKYDFLVLLDENNAVQRKFNFRQLPYTVLLDSEGYIHHKRMGYRPGDETAIEEKLLTLLTVEEQEAVEESAEEPEAEATGQETDGGEEEKLGEAEGERCQKKYVKKVKMDGAKVESAEGRDE